MRHFFTKATILTSLLFAFLPAVIFSLEISLEQNRAESGTIGFVDIDKVFAMYSLTKEEREKFKKEVKKRQDFINQKKEQITLLEGEINKLEKEKEIALALIQKQKEEIALSTPTAFEFSAGASTSTIDTQVNGAAVPSSSTVLNQSTATLPGAAVNTSSSPHKTPEKKPAEPEPENNKPIPPSPPILINLPGVGDVPIPSHKFSVSTSPAEIQKAIEGKKSEILEIKREISEFREKAEKELSNYENYKTQQIILNIYRAIRELALKEGASVIIDKKSILFGNAAVDLTSKLLRRLEEKDANENQ